MRQSLRIWTINTLYRMEASPGHTNPSISGSQPGPQGKSVPGPIESKHTVSMVTSDLNVTIPKHCKGKCHRNYEMSRNVPNYCTYLLHKRHRGLDMPDCSTVLKKILCLWWPSGTHLNQHSSLCRTAGALQNTSQKAARQDDALHFHPLWLHRPLLHSGMSQIHSYLCQEIATKNSKPGTYPTGDRKMDQTPSSILVRSMLQGKLTSPLRRIESNSYPCSRKCSVQSSISPKTEKRCRSSERVILLGIFPMKTTRRSSCIYNEKEVEGIGREEEVTERHRYRVLASHIPLYPTQRHLLQASL